MDSPSGLDNLMNYLDKNYTSNDKGRAFWQECKNNVRMESLCIAACEAGEFGSEIGAYLQGWSDINTPGLVGGITLGLAYSLLHTYCHARSHSHKASIVDAIKYALSTESACVVSATGVEYILGLATSQDPLSPVNLSIRLVGLIPAFALGLAAMSGMTYLNNKEASRFLTRGGALPDVADKLVQLSENSSLFLSDRSLEIKGSNSSLIILERKVPKSLLQRSSADESLYFANSPVCRYDVASRVVIRDTVRGFFENAGFEIRHVENVFRH